VAPTVAFEPVRAEPLRSNRELPICQLLKLYRLALSQRQVSESAFRSSRESGRLLMWVIRVEALVSAIKSRRTWPYENATRSANSRQRNHKLIVDGHTPNERQHRAAGAAAFSASSRLLDLKSTASRFQNRNIDATIIANVHLRCQRPRYAWQIHLITATACERID
jgi:hypothetical protein